MEELEMTGCIL